MNAPNKEEILKRINGMKSICAEGRKEVIGVIEAIIGEPLLKPLHVGHLYRTKAGHLRLLIRQRDTTTPTYALVEADGSSAEHGTWTARYGAPFSESKLRDHMAEWECVDLGPAKISPAT